jgi:glycosyltransferase involved in cell wall biosynthesis
MEKNNWALFIMIIDLHIHSRFSRATSKELNIEKDIIWLPQMSRKELVYYYNMADIVLDQFNVGIFALLAAEAMSCGTPVFSFPIERAKEIYDAPPPIVNVATQKELTEKLFGAW